MKKNGFIAGALAVLFAFTAVSCANPVAEETPKTPGVPSLQDVISTTGKTYVDLSSENFELKDNSEIIVTKEMTITGGASKYDLKGATVNVKTAGAKLENVKNVKELIIDAAVGEGNVTVKNCDIEKLTVNGGGANSIHIEDVKVIKVAVAKEGVRLVMEGASSVTTVEVNAQCILDSTSAEAKISGVKVDVAVKNIEIKGKTKVEKMVAFAADFKVKISSNDVIVTAAVIKKEDGHTSKVTVETAAGVTAPEIPQLSGADLDDLLSDGSANDKCKITVKVGNDDVSTYVKKGKMYFVVAGIYSPIAVFTVKEDANLMTPGDDDIVFYAEIEDPTGNDKAVEGIYYEQDYTTLFSAPFIISEDTTFYAKVVDACKITIKVGDTEVSTKVEKGSKCSVVDDKKGPTPGINVQFNNGQPGKILINPVGKGKIIEGFYYDSAYTQPAYYRNRKEITEDTTFYAKVVEACKITIKVGDEEISADVAKGKKYFVNTYTNSNTKQPRISISYSNDDASGSLTSVMDIDAPVSAGKIIEGFYYDSAYTQPIPKWSYEDTKEISEDTTFYAKVVEACKITIKVGNDEISADVAKGKKYYLYAYTDDCTKQPGISISYSNDDASGSSTWGMDLDAPVSAGKIIEGFYYDSAYTQLISMRAEDIKEISSDTTFYAKVVEACKITIKVGDEEVSTYVEKENEYYVRAGNDYIRIGYYKDSQYHENLIDNPVEAGKIIENFYYDKEYTQLIPNSAWMNPKEISEDTIFYAKIADKCTITVMLGNSALRFDVPAGEKYYFNVWDCVISVSKLVCDETDSVEVAYAEYKENLEDRNVYREPTYENPVSSEKPVLVTGDTTFYIKSNIISQ